MHQYLTKSNLDAYNCKFNKIFAFMGHKTKRVKRDGSVGGESLLVSVC